MYTILYYITRCPARIFSCTVLNRKQKCVVINTFLSVSLRLLLWQPPNYLKTVFFFHRKQKIFNFRIANIKNTQTNFQLNPNIPLGNSAVFCWWKNFQNRISSTRDNLLSNIRIILPVYNICVWYIVYNIGFYRDTDSEKTFSAGKILWNFNVKTHIFRPTVLYRNVFLMGR